MRTFTLTDSVDYKTYLRTKKNKNLSSLRPLAETIDRKYRKKRLLTKIKRIMRAKHN